MKFRQLVFASAFMSAAFAASSADAWEVRVDSCWDGSGFATKMVSTGTASVGCKYVYPGTTQYPPTNGSASATSPTGRLAASGQGTMYGGIPGIDASINDTLHIHGSWSGTIPVRVTLRMKGSVAGSLFQSESDEVLLGLLEAGTNGIYENLAEFEADILGGELHQLPSVNNRGSYKVVLQSPLTTNAAVLISTTTMVDAASPTVYVQAQVLSWAQSPSSAIETTSSKATLAVTLPTGITYTSDSGQFLGH